MFSSSRVRRKIPREFIERLRRILIHEQAVYVQGCPCQRALMTVREFNDDLKFLRGGQKYIGIKRIILWCLSCDLQRGCNRDRIGRLNMVLSLDAETFVTWGGLMARLRQEGRMMGVFDSLIAATALQHRLTIVTRNTRDFQHAPASLFDPWE